MARKFLLGCGVLSSALYLVAIDVIAARWILGLPRLDVADGE